MRVPLKSNLFSLNVRPLRQAGIPTDQVFPWTDMAYLTTLVAANGGSVTPRHLGGEDHSWWLQIDKGGMLIF